MQAQSTRAALFAISVAALILGFLICRTIVTSKLGKVLVAIRDAESRTRFLGYRVESYKLFVFTLSACMAGVAGALYVPQVGIINPSEFSPANSIEAVIWVAVGGRGTLIGAVIGAVVVNYGKTTFTSGLLAPYWLFVLGSLFVLVTLLLPRGIVGTWRHMWQKLASAGSATPTRTPQPTRRPRRSRRSERMDNRTTSALLYLDAVSVSFDGFRALNNLSLTVEPGEMRAIIGPNGAGKTTMMDVITGKTRPDTGDVYFDGAFDLTTLDETQIAELGIGRKFQKPTVFEMHTVEDNLRLALKGERRARKTLFWRETARRAGAHQRDPRHHPARRGARARRRQPVARTEAVARDRHAAGAGPEAAAGRRAGRRHDRRRDAADRRAAQADQPHKTVVVVEHDMTFVRELGVKVTCLHEGSVLAEGTIDQVSENERVVEVYLGR